MKRKYNILYESTICKLFCVIEIFIILTMQVIVPLEVYSFENTDSLTEGCNWMSAIPGNTKLCNINIPGTHDSGARYTTAIISGVIAACQKNSIPQQLNKGIRYLDIRSNSDLEINHGGMICYESPATTQKNKLTLEKVLDSVENFLEINSGETVIIQLSQEGENKKKFEKTFETKVNELIKNYKKLYKNTRKFAQNLSLNDVRGRFIIFSRDGNINHSYKFNNWGKNCEYGTPTLNNNQCLLQDNYRVLTSNLKMTSIKSFYKKVWNSEKESSNTFFINFTSCIGPFCPRYVAGTINYKFRKFVNKNSDKKFGIVLMDFPNSKLISTIYNTNISKSQDSDQEENQSQESMDY